MAFKVGQAHLATSITFFSYIDYLTEFRGAGSSALASWFDNRGSVTTKSDLWLSWRLSCCGLRFSYRLWYLSTETCKLADFDLNICFLSKLCGRLESTIKMVNFIHRLRVQLYRIALWPYRTPTAHNCCYVMTTKAFMWIHWAVFLKTLYYRYGINSWSNIAQHNWKWFILSFLVGWDANIGCIHRNWADHGLGQQSNRSKYSGTSV